MESPDNEEKMFSQRCNNESLEIFCDNVSAISHEIPNSFDLGTVPVELTCIATSSAYIIVGTGCGALFVYNRRLGRLARPLRTHSFEAVTCIHHLHLQDDYAAVGHNTGTLIVIRLPSGREGASTSLAQCIDTDSHRRSAITCVEWNSDASKVVSGDASGTVIISTVIFDTGEFYHSFLFEGPSSVAALRFLDDSVIVHNGLQMAVIECSPPSRCKLVTDFEDRTTVLSLRCTQNAVYVVEKSRICILTSSFSLLDSIPASRFGDDVTSFRCADWSEDADKIVVLSSSNEFILFELVTAHVLWRLQMNTSGPNSIIGGFCLDSDDSVFYLTKPHDVLRIGVTPIEKSLLRQDHDSSISSFLSSPKKMISTGASRITQRGVSFFNSAVSTAKDIGTSSDVSNILEDALSRVNLREDLGVLLQNVVDVVDPVQDDYSFQRRGDSKPSLLVPLPDPGIEVTEDLQSPVSVVRKEKGKVAPRRRIQSSSAEGTIQTDQSQPIAIDESTLISLRRHVLGDAIVSGSPCGSGFSFSSTPSLGGSPRNVDIHPKLSDCDGSAVKPSSSGESSEASRPSSPDLDVSKEGVPDYLPTEQALSFARHDRWEEPFGSKEESVQGAESVDCAYEYLLRQNRAPAPSNRFAEAVKITQPTLLENTSRTVNFERSRRHVVLNDRVDIWFRVSMPYTVKSFAVGGSHLAVCHRKKSPRLISLEDLDAKNPVWQTAKWSADCVSMSDDESIIWTVRRNVGFCSIDPLSATMRFTECATDGGGILDVAVGASVAWYTTMEGVSLQMELPDKAIFSKVDRDWPLISISVSVEAVWAIRADTGNLVVRVGLARCKMGLDWVEIVPEGPSRLVSVCVVRSYGFALDDAGQLWMTTGVDQQHPYGSSDAFFKVCLPSFDGKVGPVDSWTVRVSSAGLFLCVGKLMYISRSAISGHKFPREILGKYEMLDNFSVISAGSFDGSVGSVYLCRQNSEVFVYRPSKRNFITLSMPTSSCAIVSLCGTPEKLSLIDSTGRVFHCDGESSSWEADRTLPAPVCSLARSKLASWVVTCDGTILVKTTGTDEWVTVSPPSDITANVIPSQVFSSPNGIYVWISAGGRAWARVNVNERNPSGVKWTETIHTSDLCALSVGDNVVWALDASGRLLRLRGLAAGNPSGNYWRPVSAAAFRAISTDSRSDLWVIDMENHLVRHLSEVFVPEQFHSCDVRESYEFV